MDRRTLIALGTAAALAGETAPARADGTDAEDNLATALPSFLRLPGRKSYLIHVGPGGKVATLDYRADAVMFVASAFKTFVLAQFLRAVEAGRLDESAQLDIDDSVRMFGSPVFEKLTGSTTGRSVLEAMIAHSDNTATDAAMAQAGATRIRTLIAGAGLAATRIPDSTRIFSSYIVGAPAGVDLGWPGVLDAFRNPPPRTRPLLNPVSTIASTAADFVTWYEKALSGRFFSDAATLREFKRIHAMSVQIPLTVPPDTIAYAKGGEAPDVFGSSAKSFCGQMLVGSTPVTFSFLLNWNAADGEFQAVQAAYFAAIRQILRLLKAALR